MTARAAVCSLTCALLLLAFAPGCPPDEPPAGDRDADGDPDDTDCAPDDPGVFHGAPDLYGDGEDRDCDGIDGKDRDGDGFAGNAPADAEDGDCDDTDETVFPGADEICDGVDNDCDGAPLDEETDDDGDGLAECAGDCDDTDDRVSPELAEVCDGRDNDCDGTPDPSEVDADEDGWMVCGGPSGEPDCDDDDAMVHPGADDVCDGIADNDCDGEPDGLETDDDGDGFDECGNAGGAPDCDDGDPDAYPGATEQCNGRDDDCDGALPADEADDDGDGAMVCEGDCDDADADVGPGFPELCDGLDNDCDGVANDLDDGDGDGFTACDGDCDDADAAIHPAALEEPDGIDNDCDGLIDESPCQLVFDGVDDLATLPETDTPAIAGAVTIEAWVRVDGPSPVNHSLIAARWGTELDGTAGLRLVHDTASHGFRFEVSSDGVDVATAGPGAAATMGDWHHVAGVYDGTRLALFVDGALDDAVPYSDGIHDNGLGLTLGDYHPDWIHGSYDFQLDGVIAAVRVTDGERYASPFTPPATLIADADTLVLLSLDEGVDQTLHDSAPNGGAGYLGITNAAEGEDPAWVCDPEDF